MEGSGDEEMDLESEKEKYVAEVQGESERD
jgi:hypothetical protein